MVSGYEHFGIAVVIIAIDHHSVYEYQDSKTYQSREAGMTRFILWK